MNEKESGILIYDLEIDNGRVSKNSSISTVLADAEQELQAIEEKISENLETVKRLTPECDKIDYVLSATSGVLCGVIDIFLVGKPGESPVGDITDKWFENRTKDFAKLCEWDGEGTVSAAIKHLEKKFKIPYDQRGAGDIASWLLDLNPTNHHFKSLGHNPTLLGLFFSILDQFCDTSHFVSEGELISIQQVDGDFELRGGNIPAKLFSAFVNWFGHLISDQSGSSGSKGRGMGIPSPIWSWTNDVIAIKRKLNIPVSEFNKNANELALQIYKEGYDARFLTAQAIPVFVNELIVRLFYSIRRMLKCFMTTSKDERSFVRLWKECEPFSNVTVKRMLTVAHGTFCLMDVGDSVIRGFTTGGGYFNVVEFFMRLNIIGVGRFAISLYGETNRGMKKTAAKQEVVFWQREKVIIEDYIEGLVILCDTYDDKELLMFVDDIKNSNMYKQAFEKTILLAEKRNVPDEDILKSKEDIDRYFKGGLS